MHKTNRHPAGHHVGCTRDDAFEYAGRQFGYVGVGDIRMVELTDMSDQLFEIFRLIQIGQALKGAEADMAM